MLLKAITDTQILKVLSYWNLNVFKAVENGKGIGLKYYHIGI